MITFIKNVDFSKTRTEKENKNKKLTHKIGNRNPSYFIPKANPANLTYSTKTKDTPIFWMTTTLNQYLNFSNVCQAFMVEQENINKKTGKKSHEVVYGITSTPTGKANVERVIKDNRKHRSVVSCHYIFDLNNDKGRSQIRTENVHENITRPQ